MMDAEVFSLARNTQHRQLAIRFPQMGVDTTQAKWIVDSINEHSSMPFLAAVILMLPSACQAAVAAACNHASDPAELLALARHSAETNHQQAVLFSNQPAISPTAPPQNTPGYSAGSGATGHAGVLPMSPPVEIQQCGNGGILSSDLAYPESEAEVVDEKPKVGFSTDADVLGTQMHNNLTPSSRFKSAWAKDVSYS